MSGLKDYYQHGGKPGEGHMSSDDKMPKMASAVGILGHLASKHGQDIRNALMKLFEVIDLIGLLRYCLCSKFILCIHFTLQGTGEKSFVANI